MGNEGLFTHDAHLCGGLSVASGRRARRHDLIALIEENGPGLSDDVRDEEELMRAAIRLLECPVPREAKGTASSSGRSKSSASGSWMRATLSCANTTP
jgi:hypothetical protein